MQAQRLQASLWLQHVRAANTVLTPRCCGDASGLPSGLSAVVPRHPLHAVSRLLRCHVEKPRWQRDIGARTASVVLDADAPCRRACAISRLVFSVAPTAPAMLVPSRPRLVCERYFPESFQRGDASRVHERGAAARRAHEAAQPFAAALMPSSRLPCRHASARKKRMPARQRRPRLRPPCLDGLQR